jgi:hypothetical protein
LFRKEGARASAVYLAGILRQFRSVKDTPTLAEKLGTTTHLSPLLHKARRLGLDANGLEQLAIQRGCDYYQGSEPPIGRRVDVKQFSNVELAIALLNPALRYSPQTLRLGAAMLSAPGNSPVDIAWQTILERGEAIVRYVAQAGMKFEPENPFWPELVALLPGAPGPKAGVLPHPTRFVAMTGLTRHGLETVTEWIRPIQRMSTAHG